MGPFIQKTYSAGFQQMKDPLAQLDAGGGDSGGPGDAVRSPAETAVVLGSPLVLTPLLPPAGGVSVSNSNKYRFSIMYHGVDINQQFSTFFIPWHT